jgi:ribosomal protein S18 acetylase RimI-like enzyme
MRTKSLRIATARELRPLLAEEAAHWAEQLLWDYRDVAAAVETGLDRRALAGQMLEETGRPVAYCYYMLEGGRTIVGSVFVTACLRGQGIEESLLAAVLEEAQGDRAQSRVECQTLFSTSPGADGCFERAGFVGRPRRYMMRDLEDWVASPGERATLRPFRRSDLAIAAEVIHESHRGSLDAALNRTYSTPERCRGFVETLVLRSGCGRFNGAASFVAEEEDTIAGVVLTSFLSPKNGHICQVSVRPKAQRRGTGRQLMAAAMDAFQSQGLAVASLSVTVGNDGAGRLYERLGYRVRREFAAHAWVRPPARIELPA